MNQLGGRLTDFFYEHISCTYVLYLFYDLILFITIDLRDVRTVVEKY